MKCQIRYVSHNFLTILKVAATINVKYTKTLHNICVLLNICRNVTHRIMLVSEFVFENRNLQLKVRKESVLMAFNHTFESHIFLSLKTYFYKSEET